MSAMLNLMSLISEKWYMHKTGKIGRKGAKTYTKNEKVSLNVFFQKLSVRYIEDVKIASVFFKFRKS